MPTFLGVVGTAGGLGSALGSTATTSSTHGYWISNSDGTNPLYVWGTPTSTSTQHAQLMMAQQYASQTLASTGSGLAGLYSNASIWEQDVTPAEYYYLAQGRAVQYRQRTAEEQERARLREEERQRQYAEATRRQAQAVMRSKELLLANLTAEQRRTFTVNRWFIIQGGKTKTTYRIRDAGHAGNIDIMKGEKVTHRLCCHCDHSIPTYDNMLAQKITLEWDEERFLKMANRSAA